MREVRSLLRVTARLLFFFASIFLSQASSALAQTPPIDAVPIIGADIEAPRDVSASNWSSLYCLRWTDGCETCSRDELWSDVRCEKHELGSCMGKPVSCEAAELAVLTAACESFNVIGNCGGCISSDGAEAMLCRKPGCPEGYRGSYGCSVSWRSFKRECDAEADPGQRRSCRARLAARERIRPIVMQRFRLKELP